MKSKKQRKLSQPLPRERKLDFIYTLLALVLGLSCHSCAYVPAERAKSASNATEELAAELGTAILKQADTSVTNGENGSTIQSGDSPNDFSACPQFFANAQPPVVAYRPTDRALCYDAFAILHSGESKTAVFVAQRLTKASVAQANEPRTNMFFSDARLRSAERATLEDYRGSGFDRGHMAPAGDMPTAQAMAQSFSLANMVPQAPEHNRGVWAKSVEAATRKYAARATGNVYVITGPVYEPSIPQSPSIGPGKVRVPKYLFKLVYDQDKNWAWAHWHLNDDATRGSKPISYEELVRRTGIHFLPSVNLNE